MVNINNYGANPNVGVNTPYTTNYQNQNVATANNQAGGISNDSYAFNLSNVQTGRVPDVKVGMWDKVTGYFKDVHSSPENLKLFKAFESAMGGYLQPGSTNTLAVKDLQKKLSMVGIPVNVNGQFGPSTETAVIKFKNSVGINDGFLNKSGQYAVTPVVTPQMLNILNSQVAVKLNPNATGGGGVTQEELKWAKDFMNKVKTYQYQPSSAERQKYESIYQRQQMGASVQSGNYSPVNIQAPTQQEIDWAKDLANRIKNFGYTAKPDEVQRYNDIANRQKIAKTATQNQNTQQQQNVPGPVSQQEIDWANTIKNKVKAGQQVSPQDEAKYESIRQRIQTYGTAGGVQNTNNTGNGQPVTQQELQWASQLENKVNNQKYNPSPDEISRYNDIFGRYNAQGAGNTQSTGNTGGVTQEELNWAQQFESKVNTQNYRFSAQEKAKYEDIYNRYQKNGVSSPQNSNAPVDKPTDREVQWAMELERKTKEENYNPTPTELAIYNEIANKLEAYNKQQQDKTTSVGATPDELQWASQMYSKMQNGYKPTQTELSILNNIQSKISGGDASGNVGNNSGNIPNQNNVPAQNNFTAVGEFSYSDATVTAFRNAFPGVTFKGSSVPYLPDSVGKQVAAQYGFGSVSELQSSIGAVVDGKFGPETYFRLVQAQGGGQNVTPTTQGNNQQGVTQKELDWAVELQNKFGQGYKPTQQEMDKYTNIFDRYQASGNQVVSDNSSNTGNVGNTSNTGNTNTTSSGPPTQEELNWAVEMQGKYSQGYKPSQQEMNKYTDIFNRYQASGNQVASGNQTQNNTSVYKPAVDPNVPTITVDANSSDPDLQWALQLLDKIQQQGYTPNDAEIQKYEQVMAKNQSIVAYP